MGNQINILKKIKEYFELHICYKIKILIYNCNINLVIHFKILKLTNANVLIKTSWKKWIHFKNLITFTKFLQLRYNLKNTFCLGTVKEIV